VERNALRGGLLLFVLVSLLSPSIAASLVCVCHCLWYDDPFAVCSLRGIRWELHIVDLIGSVDGCSSVVLVSSLLQRRLGSVWIELRPGLSPSTSVAAAAQQYKCSDYEDDGDGNLDGRKSIMTVVVLVVSWVEDAGICSSRGRLSVDVLDEEEGRQR
jgi:hypothetical protein